MAPAPTILVREFDGLDTCYRIPARRARNYWELLENAHNTFSRPWERYNAHLHVDENACADRISPSEWDAGAYFDAEFVVGGRIVLFVHFEEMKGRMADMPSASDDQVAGEEEDRMWYSGTYGNEGVRTKSLYHDYMDNVYEAPEDPYPSFPTSLPPDDFAISSQPAAPAIKPTTPSKPVFIDDTNNQRHIDTGIIVGHAKPHCCNDPAVRPVARALLNSVGAVLAYIPAKYAKRVSVGKGDVQIAQKDVDYVAPYNISSDEIRSKAVKLDLQAKLASIDQTHSGPSNATPQTQADVGNWHPDPTSQAPVEGYITIGHAHSEAYHNTVTPVHATIDDDDALVAFTYASGQKSRFAMGDVVYLPEYACLAAERQVDAVRQRMGGEEYEFEEDEMEEFDEDGVFLTDSEDEDDEQRNQIVDISDVEG